MAERRGKDPEVINGMLDRLSHRMSYQEEAEFRRAAMDRRSPTHLRDLHDHVAGLLVKHGIATWNQLHGSSHGIRKPKKPPGEHTLADYPGIAEWWHPSKNGGLHPEDYARASNKRVWLQCPGCPSCGEVHQRDVRVSNLTLHSREIACPACECVPGKAFCGCQAVSAHDLLAAEWHEDNPYPATVPLHSGKDVKWRCRRAGCGRIWVAKPRNRCRNLGCPKCS